MRNTYKASGRQAATCAIDTQSDVALRMSPGIKGFSGL